jgi:hypothetical protein
LYFLFLFILRWKWKSYINMSGEKMRKAILSVFFIGVFFGALNAQSITVTSPTTGNTWYLGSTHTITWTKSGTMPANVAVRLRRAGAPETELAVVNITDSTANDGSLSWSIPASVPAGNYFIRVRTSSPDVIGNSGTFSIAPVLVIPNIEKPHIIKLLLPDLVVCLAWAGEIPYIYQDIRVRVWVKNFGLASAPASTVKIYVEGNGDQFVQVPVLAPQGEFYWSKKYDWGTCGHKTVRATVDPNGQIAESNENNNMLGGSIKVSCGETGFLLEMNSCSEQQ